MTALWSAGKSQTFIAREFSTAQVVVSRVLRAKGIKPVSRFGSRRGANSNFWKGGRIVTGEGYVAVLISADHPFASMRTRMGYVLEHRLVMASALARPLRPNETVHHVNGDHTDNRAENLQIRHGRHGNGIALVCLDCGSVNVGPKPIPG